MPLLAQIQTPPTPHLFFFSSPLLSLSHRSATKLPLSSVTHRRRRLILSAALPITDGDLISSLDEPDADAEAGLPAVRSYETDLARLILIGGVALDQALTAAAVDGGDAAEQHLSSGASTMVVETVSPALSGGRGTVSTRLFLPAEKVKEKAEMLRSSLTPDVLSASGAVKKDILAMAFRQVVMQRLWMFELSVFRPGTERDTEDLANSREELKEFIVRSSDEKFLSAIAEVVCSCVLNNIKMKYTPDTGGWTFSGGFHWFRKPERMVSRDSSVCLYNVSEDEIVKTAKSHLEEFDLVKGKVITGEKKLKNRWWDPPSYSRLDKVGGLGFSDWANEYIPAYRLQVDTGHFRDTKLEGWKNMADNRWEVLLTHFQMVELVNLLDMFYEDQHTIPDKKLLCSLVTRLSDISQDKKPSWKMLLYMLAGGCIFVFISIVAQLYRPRPFQSRKTLEQHNPPSSQIDYFQLESLEATDLDALCISVIKQVKDALGWPGDVIIETSVGAWIGILPSYLRNGDLDAVSCKQEPASSAGEVPSSLDISANVGSPLGTNTIDMQTSAQDIASYQVTLSGDGKIIGFQPTNRVAVDHWASNPLAKIFYGERNLSPGFLEPSLKIPLPNNIFLVELLMSVKSGSCFALARPIK